MSEPHLDPLALAALKEIMRDGFGLLVDTFLADSSDRLARLHGALAMQDAPAVRQAAHSFKGSSSNMAAPRLSALCHQLELLAREGQLDGASTLLEAIEGEFAQVRQLLDLQRPLAS